MMRGLFLAMLFVGAPGAAMAALDSEVRFVDHLNDLPADFAWMQEQGKPMMIFFHASYCGYCKMIDEEFIIPMRLKPKYQDRLLIRRVQTDGTRSVAGLHDDTLSHPEVSRKLGVIGVPFVIFLAPSGERIASISGTAPSYYNVYLDRKIELAERCAKDMSPAECREEIDEPGFNP
ncbi:MAG: thioredoxin family protein [Pseudomonadota bacterium]